jgi:hypothetical protein
MVGKVFVYKDAIGQIISHRVYFLPDGRVFGTRRPQEDSWDFTNGAIVITSVDGNQRVVFKICETADGELCLVSGSADSSEMGSRRFLVELRQSGYQSPIAAKQARLCEKKPAVVLVR